MNDFGCNGRRALAFVGDAKERSGRVILCNATGVVEDVLSLSRIVAVDKPLALVPDREDAIAMLSSRAKGKNENL